MLQVLAAGLIALATKWLLDGGIRSRERRVIIEELELAALLDEDSAQATVLRASALVRLHRYLRPPLAKRLAPFARSWGPFLVSLGLSIFALVTSTDTSTTTPAETIGIALAFGTLAALAAVVLQRLTDAVLAAREARRARQRSL